MVRTETEFEKSLRIQGFGIEEENGKHKRIRQKTDKIKLVEIETLSQYVEEIKKLNSSSNNPVFYRGQTNANWLQTPAVLRANSRNENLIIDMFMQRFPNEFAKRTTNLDKLSLMQHFLLRTRLMDITESPFAALYFACQPMKKFGDPEQNKDCYGSIFLYREGSDNKENPPDDLKYSSSRTVSIIASTAFMKDLFSSGNLEMEYLRDRQEPQHLNNFLHFKDIMSRSVIVRAKRDNPRIINQQGAFILCNANRIKSAVDFDENERFDLMKYINTDDGSWLNLDKERYCDSPFARKFEGKSLWNFCFEKITPYSIENEMEWMKQDPFDFKKIYYRNKSNMQLVFLVSPKAKPELLKELEKFNFTEDFIYPDMDNVANEINLRFS